MAKKDRYSHLGDEVFGGDGTDEQTPGTDSPPEPGGENGSSGRNDQEEPTGESDGIHVVISDGDDEVQVHVDAAGVTPDDLHEAIRRVDDASGHPRSTWGYWLRTASAMQRSLLVGWAATVRASTTGVVPSKRRRNPD